MIHTGQRPGGTRIGGGTTVGGTIRPHRAPLIPLWNKT